MKRLVGFSCLRCGADYPSDLAIDSRGCPVCFKHSPANLRVIYDRPGPERNGCAPAETQRLPSLWRYADMLPCDEDDAVSLGEGLTPLLPARRVGLSLGVGNLFIKYEGSNPTWSHKDRFSTLAVSAAREQGARVMATSSSGNAGASLAAYAARAGLACVVTTFAGTAGPMLAQIRKYGAIIVPFARKADRWPFLAEGVERFGWFATSPFRAPVVGSHPIGIEGYKTLAYEIVEQMHGAVPDWCVMPVCYGDALAGLWQGFKDLLDQRTITHLPRLVAAEVHGSLTAALAEEGDRLPDIAPAFDPLAVSIGATRSTFQALKALRESAGVAVPVGNAGLIAVQEKLAALEGIFAELASVTPFAAIASLKREGVIAESDSAVAVVTASGLKDLDRSVDTRRPLPTFGSRAEAWAYLEHQEQLWAAADGAAAREMQKETHEEGTMDRRAFVIGSALAASSYTPSARASDNRYPSDGATIIVGFSAGGAGDLAVRIAADYAKTARSFPVGLDFRPGAGGTIATDQVSRAKPDGATLSLFSVSPLMVAPHLQDVPYDPLADFTYVASYAGISIPFFVRADSEFRTWDSVLDYARANPGQLRWATAAPRGVAHISTEAAFRQEGVSAVFVPFGGGAEAITALLGGHIDAVVSSDYGPHLEAGAIRLLAETGPQPIPELPDLPTFKQLGYPLSIPAAYGLFGPAGLPAAVVAWWEALLSEMTESPLYQDFLRTLRGHRVFQDSATFTRTVIDGYRRLGHQIEVLGLRP